MPLHNCSIFVIPAFETVSQSSFVIAKRLSGAVAISMMSIKYEIASVVTLPRKDITTRSVRRYDTIADYISLCKSIKINPTTH